MESRDCGCGRCDTSGRGVFGWALAMLIVLLAALLLAVRASHGLEINRNQVGYETPIAALESIRDSTGLTLPMTLDYWAPSETELANLDLWLHGLHPLATGTYAVIAKDTLVVGRVYR